MDSMVPTQSAPRKSTPKVKAPTKAERAALKAELARRIAAQEVMHKINLVLSTCKPTPLNFTFFRRASVAYGGIDVPTLETVYLDLANVTGTKADGMEWAPLSEYKAKRGNFYAYCKFMERYQVWAAQPSRPIVKKSTKKGTKAS